MTLRRSKSVALSCAQLVSLLREVRVINLHELSPIFVRLQCQVLLVLVFGGYVWYFGSLHPASEISSDTEYSFSFFWKRGLRRFVMCAIVLMIFVQTYRKILGDFTESKTQTFQNDIEYVPKMSV